MSRAAFTGGGRLDTRCDNEESSDEESVGTSKLTQQQKARDAETRTLSIESFMSGAGWRRAGLVFLSLVFAGCVVACAAMGWREKEAAEAYQQQVDGMTQEAVCQVAFHLPLERRQGPDGHPRYRTGVGVRYRAVGAPGNSTPVATVCWSTRDASYTTLAAAEDFLEAHNVSAAGADAERHACWFNPTSPFDVRLWDGRTSGSHVNSPAFLLCGAYAVLYLMTACFLIVYDRATKAVLRRRAAARNAAAERGARGAGRHFEGAEALADICEIDESRSADAVPLRSIRGGGGGGVSRTKRRREGKVEEEEERRSPAKATHTVTFKRLAAGAFERVQASLSPPRGMHSPPRGPNSVAYAKLDDGDDNHSCASKPPSVGSQ